MRDFHEEGSSSGLMVGMIIGGVVALVLIVLVVFGGVFYWWFAWERPGPPAAILVAKPMAEEGPAIEAPGEMELAKAPGIQVENPREHLLGIWESKGAGGGVAIMEFRADGTLHMTDKAPGKDDVKQPLVRWEVRKEKDGLKIKIDTVQGVPNDHVLRFLDNDRLVIDTLEGVIYHRRPAEAAK